MTDQNITLDVMTTNMLERARRNHAHASQRFQIIATHVEKYGTDEQIDEMIRDTLLLAGMAAALLGINDDVIANDTESVYRLVRHIERMLKWFLDLDMPEVD